MGNVSTKVVEEIKTHILCSITFLKKNSCHLWDNVEKYCRVGQATDDNMAHAHCMLDNQGYTHTIYNTHCFSTATMIARTHLSVMIYVHCLSCLSLRRPLPAAFFAVHFVCYAIYRQVPWKNWEIFYSITFCGRVVFI